MEWFTSSLNNVLMVVLSTTGIYIALIVFTRLSGLRSFSKMSSFDFATTIAMGSLIATTVVTSNPPLLLGVAALATIFLLQYIAAMTRRFTGFGHILFDNRPIVLMVGDKFIEKNMRSVRVTESDVWAKLREANVFDLSEVRAVVLETTGDVSVLHRANDDELDPFLLRDVRGSEYLKPEHQDEDDLRGVNEPALGSPSPA